jgi:hypothetical protein
MGNSWTLIWALYEKANKTTFGKYSDNICQYISSIYVVVYG